VVCIPCGVVPVLPWVYGNSLEPSIYPLCSPSVTQIWRIPGEESDEKNKGKEDCQGSHTNGSPTESSDRKAEVIFPRVSVLKMDLGEGRRRHHGAVGSSSA
uniref:Uncharacterized protein n=1 Tax=Oryctolagus cuniculus TaxID=9986 RepID=A0A5F9CIH7_RABIT